MGHSSSIPKSLATVEMVRASGVFIEDQVFSDGIGQVAIIGGTVRLDFVTYSPTEKDAKGQPLAVFSQRIIMSAEGFMHSAQKIQEAAQAVSKLAQRLRESQSAEQPASPAVSHAGSVAVVAEPAPAPQKRPFP